MGGEWRSCYFHSRLNLLLVIYVDDFTMLGPVDNLAKGWDLLRPGLNIDLPADISGQAYLGCQYNRREVKLPGGWQSHG